MVECTNSICHAEATKVMAYEGLGVRCMFVAPYCDEHAEDVARHSGAIPAAGPALSEDVRGIEGVR